MANRIRVGGHFEKGAPNDSNDLENYRVKGAHVCVTIILKTQISVRFYA